MITHDADSSVRFLDLWEPVKDAISSSLGAPTQCPKR